MKFLMNRRQAIASLLAATAASSVMMDNAFAQDAKILVLTTASAAPARARSTISIRASC